MEDQFTEQGTVSLDDALSQQSTVGRPINVFVCNNSGNRTFSTVLTLFELQEYTQVANDPERMGQVAQRKLDMKHATDIAKYFLKGLIYAAERKKIKQILPISDEFKEIMKNLGTQPYLSIPPLVASYRNCEPNGSNIAVRAMTGKDGETGCFKIFLKPGDVLWVVDGQHRRKGLQLVYEFLNEVISNQKYPGRSSLYPTKSKEPLSAADIDVWADCFEMLQYIHLAVEIHLGLKIEQERQLFHDLNNLGKRVERSLALDFDMSNPINRFIKEDIIFSIFDSVSYDISYKEKPNWQESGSNITRRDLAAINAVLFLSKSNISGASAPDVESKKDTAIKFWEQVIQIPNFIDESAKQLTVTAQPVVLKALAKLTYDFFFGKNKEWTTPENQEKLLNSFTTFDFSHQNPLWRYYLLTEEERVANNLNGLEEYLPSTEEGNRDLGGYDSDSQIFRFGAKHNDIFPIIGDMIRWKIGLPARKRSEAGTKNDPIPTPVN